MPATYVITRPANGSGAPIAACDMRSMEDLKVQRTRTMTDLLVNRFPLLVGATGHRDLRDQDVPRLEQEIADIIAALKRDYLGSDAETPLILLSALAEGADQLVARVALAQ